MKIRLLLLFFLLGQSCAAFSEDIIVTSNLDAGTGSLRAALNRAAANGTTEKDHILFNLSLASDADRTIITNTPLPMMSSNLIIDGTSQNGGFYGITHAKVKVLCNNDFITNQEPILRGSNVNELEIYGLWLENLNSYGAVNGAIALENCGKVTIGGLNKGNFIRRNYITIDEARELVFQGNVCFTNESGTIGEGLHRINLNGIKKILIGGSEAAGNMITGAIIIGGMPGIADYTKKEIEISFNNIGASFDRSYSDRSFGIEASRISISGSYDNGRPVYEEHNVLIKKNIITACNTTSVIVVSNTSGNVTIQGNGFDTDLTGSRDYSTSKFRSGKGISLSTKSRVLIGGENPGDANIIRSQIGAVYNANQPEGSCKISRNRMFCLNDSPYSIGFGPQNTPTVEITSTPFEPLEGKATPGAIVELFYDDACSGCTPETYFATVTADLTGKWTYPDPVNGAVVASATLNNETSLFTDAFLKMDGLQVKNTSCALDDGAISGIQTSNPQIYKWTNELGETVGTTLDMDHLKPGRYTLTLGEGDCSKSSSVITVRDGTPAFNDVNANITQPSCGLNNGSINGITVSSADFTTLKTEWYDQNNTLKANTLNLQNVPAGKYTLKATNTVLNCTQIYGPVILSNTSGPNIDENSATIVGSNCGSSTGSISDIITSGTGLLKYTWKNSSSRIVSRNKDLISQPAGQYILEVSDDSNCGPVYTATITIPEINGVTMDNADVLITKATCNTSNGSITGLIVDGARDYKWYDASNTIISRTVNLAAVPAGKYRLEASNASCTKTSEEFTVELAQSTLTYSSTKVITNAQCNLANGRIEVIFTVDQPVSCRWQNKPGQTVGSGRILEHMFPGAYDLYITDDLGCERFLLQYNIFNTESAVIDHTSASVTDDQCDSGIGRINAPGISGGQRPYFYEWKDKNGLIIGSGASLNFVKSGDYQLTIGDALACSRQTLFYTVKNISSNIAAPTLNDIKICFPGTVVLQVMQPKDGMYILYDQNGNLLDRTNGGIFNIEAKENHQYTVVLQQGSCRSLPTTVKVTIENNGINKLANAISPNSDGHNDEWLIPGIVNYPTATVMIYNRYGARIFNSTGYKTPFDGRFNGADLPAGVYYYVIDLKRGCGIERGSLTIMR